MYLSFKYSIFELVRLVFFGIHTQFNVLIIEYYCSMCYYRMRGRVYFEVGN